MNIPPSHNLLIFFYKANWRGFIPIHFLSPSLNFHEGFRFNLYLALTNSLFHNRLGTDQTPLYASLPNSGYVGYTLVNQSGCWLYQHVDSEKEPEVVFVLVVVNTWWTEHGGRMSNRVWHPQQDKHQPASPSESFRPQKSSIEAQGLSFAQ